MAPHAELDINEHHVAAINGVIVGKKQGSRHSRSTCSLLGTSGRQIIDAHGRPIILKGVGLGGHLNMENFITGYPGHEHEHRAAMAQVLGKEKAQYFFDKFLEYFFTDADAEFFASLGLNCIRVPFNYRHFIDDQQPDIYKPDGFKWLDRIVDICGRHNLYVILDLHAVPGGQNQDWHSDSGLAKALFWEHRVFQDQAIALWVEIAKRYAGNPVVAGYNPLNEPADPEHTRLVDWYERAGQAIRAVDPDHILFIDGNTYAMDFSHFPEQTLPNAVYACHDYAMLGFPLPDQAPYAGTPEQKQKLRKQFERKAQFSREKEVPLWNGEFGPVYAQERQDPQAEGTNKARYGVLKEQLKIYGESQTSWSIWLYKDIGHQGMVHVDVESPYMKLILPFVEKKEQIGLDFWACFDKSKVENVYRPFLDGLKGMVPEHLQKKKYPQIWTFERHVERVVRECLLSEYLALEFAELFAGKTEEELDELARSFLFENCVKREGLNEALRLDAESSLSLSKA